jgi:uncharacterized membrane protein
MATIFARVRRPSLRQGLIFGLILGIIQIIYGFAADFIASNDVQSFLSTIGLALFLLFGFLAGRRASQETGRLGTGVLAGIWTGVVGSLLVGLVSLIRTLVTMSSIIANNQQIIRSNPQLYAGVKPSDITASYVLTTFFFDLVVFFLLFITLLTLAGGTFGAFLGRRRARMDVASAEADLVVASARDEASTDEAMR